MNRSSEFPPDPTPSESAPPVPDIPKDLLATSRKLGTSTEDEESDEVAMVAPSTVEVPPPPPVEKERRTSSVSDSDDVNETKEILLS